MNGRFAIQMYLGSQHRVTGIKLLYFQKGKVGPPQRQNTERRNANHTLPDTLLTTECTLWATDADVANCPAH